MKLEELSCLPGAELVLPGLADLAAGRTTKEAMLVACASQAFRELGLLILGKLPARPEMELYRMLAEEYGGEAHARYGAWVRRLVSFKHALEFLVRHPSVR